jgi:hypothetical protein
VGNYAAVAAEVSREAAERVAAFIPGRERGERCTSGRIPYGLPELRPRKSAERQIVTGSSRAWNWEPVSGSAHHVHARGTDVLTSATVRNLAVDTQIVGHLPLTGRGAGKVPEPAAGTFAAGSGPFAATR